MTVNASNRAWRNRPVFDGTRDAPPDATPSRCGYPCLAHGCPMPGTIFTQSGKGPGICAWHYGSNAHTMPRITEVLRNWQCLADAINAARRFACDPGLAALEAQTMRELWRNLSALTTGWEGLAPKPGQRLSDWGRQLEKFLSTRVAEDVRNKPAGSEFEPFRELELEAV